MEVRLVGGGEAYGRVEVSYEEMWGTICHDGWGFNDAKVVCRQLGFLGSRHGFHGNAHFGQGTGKIWLDNVVCDGNEGNLRLCGHLGWAVGDCNHGKDASVYCDRGMSICMSVCMVCV